MLSSFPPFPGCPTKVGDQSDTRPDIMLLAIDSSQRVMMRKVAGHYLAAYALQVQVWQ